VFEKKSNAPHLSRCSPGTLRRSKTPGKRASIWNTIALAPLSGVTLRLKIKLEMYASVAHINSVPVLTKERRRERLVARVSGSDKLLFQRAASLEGRSVATFVITHAREMARRIVADQESIELDTVQSRRFVKALLNPISSAPNRLKKAAAAYRQRVAA
jgi:uncharacterized protein (DUF1778 family)